MFGRFFRSTFGLSVDVREYHSDKVTAYMYTEIKPDMCSFKQMHSMITNRLPIFQYIAV